MIDNGEGSNWSRALVPDRRSLKFCTTEELNAPFALEAIQRWYGCSMGDALEMRGAEMRRRTTTNDYQQGE